MAVRIPYIEQQTTPTTAGINVRVPNVQVNDDIGRSLMNLGQAGQDAALGFYKDISEGEAREGDNALLSSIDGVLYDAENGYLGTVDKDAIDGRDAARTAINDAVQKASSAIKTNAGKRMFERAAAARTASALRSIDSHALQQSKAYNVGQAKARSTLAQNAAINTWADPAEYFKNKETMLSEAVYGLDGAAAELARAEALQGLHAGVLNRMLAQEQYTDVRNYLDTNADGISAEFRVRVETILKGAENSEFAQQFAMQQVGKPYAEQIAAAREITDPERQRQAITAINQSVAIERTAREEREQGARDTAWQLVAQGQTVPETVLADMDGASRADLQDYVTRKAAIDAQGKIPTTNWRVYYQARQDIAAGTPINLQALSLDLAPAELKEIVKLATPVNEGGTQDALFTLQQRVDRVAKTVIPDFDSEEGKASAGLFQNEVDRLVRVESDAKKRKLTPDEEQQIVDSVAMNRVFVDEWGIDPELPVGILTEEQLGDAYVKVGRTNIRLSSIPDTDRRLIIAALRATNVPVTEFEIAKMYLANKTSRTTR